ncbi:MAG: hypothetical protein D6763_01885 [Alphaproteobacteria bacterium]|nr:MAG: hypothetical protein D6763_01885 [Alphaproteobacteria bacterium]
MNRRQFIGGCSACAAMAASQAALMRASLADGLNLAPELPPGYRPDGDSTEAGLWLLTEKFEDQLRTSSLVIRDDNLKTYLTELACRLGHNHCRDMRVYPMRIPYFNASMAANGMMQVWSGLMLRVSSEAQLAAVIGHEMGHYLRRHTIKGWENARDTMNALSFLTVGLTAAGAGYQTVNIVQLAGYGLIFSYSRDMEREADAYGVQLMHKANYNPWEASKVWRRLIAERDAAKYKRQDNPFFATHPSEAERAQTLANYASELGYSETQPSFETGSFEKIIGQHRAMMLEDELKLRHFNRTALILDWLIEDGFRLGETYYYQGEMFRLRNQEGDEARAKAAYQAALRHDTAPPEAHRALGFIQLKSGDRATASRSFRRYLELKPDATDRAMISSYIGG